MKRLKIVSIHVHNFKGLEEATFHFEGCDAVGFNRRHGRTFHNIDNEYVAVLGKRHVLEEAGTREGVNGAGALVGREFITGTEGQVGKHRAGFRTHNPFNTNVGNDERRSAVSTHQGRKHSSGRLRQIREQDSVSQKHQSNSRRARMVSVRRTLRIPDKTGRADPAAVRTAAKLCKVTK